MTPPAMHGDADADTGVTTAPLAALQRWLLDALIAPGALDRKTIDAALLPGPVLNAARCLAIYQRSYILRLRKCLAEQFPATRHALGDALFDDFADAYLRACPSDSHTLYALGRRFPDWLEAARFDRGRPPHEREDWIDFMVDLAHYERELFHLFDAPGHEDAQAAADDRTAGVWPDSATDDSALTLQSCLVLAQYRYGVAWYYHEVRAGRSPAFPPRSPSYVVILRRDYQTTTYPVSGLHHRFLTALRHHGSVERALADIAAWSGHTLDAVTRSWATDVRGAWLEAGFFISKKVPIAAW